jgi:hypothetical protein
MIGVYCNIFSFLTTGTSTTVATGAALASLLASVFG